MARRILALIAARAGSRGLRHKNTRCVDGTPLLVRAIRLAQACGRAGEEWRVLVSTDSQRYARMARQAGAWVPFVRPRRLATSRARLIDVVLHALAQASQSEAPFDTIVLLSAVTPLTAAIDVRRALRLHFREAAAVASVTRDPTPDAWRFDLRGGRLTSRAGSPARRRQEFPPVFRLNGAVFVASPAWLRRHRRFVVHARTLGLVMPKARSLDIEDQLDLEVGRVLVALETRQKRI